MKYHSTRKSIITITIIIISLLLISAISISRFNAQTPIQAVSEAVFSNLEIPNNYSIEIEDINESFIKRQSIKSITIKKSGNSIISLENLDINQSIFDYISYYFFDKNMKLSISVEKINVNIESDINDFLKSLSKIKIKDNTIAIQSRLENDVEEQEQDINLKDLIDHIITKEYIDLSPIIGDSINIDINLNVNSGDIYYKKDNIEAATAIDNLSFDIKHNGIVNSIDLKLKDLNFNLDSNTYIFSKLFLIYHDKQVNLILRDSFSQDENNSPFKFSIFHTQLQYNLEKVGQVIAKFGLLNISTPNFIISSDNMNSQIKTNFEDFSIILSPDDFNLDFVIEDKLNNLKFNKANIGLSRVNERLSFYLNNENFMNLSINDRDYIFEDIDLSLFSSENFFDKINLRLEKSILEIADDISLNLNNLVVNGDLDINNELLMSEGELDFNKLNNINKSINNALINLKSNILIINGENKVKTDISSYIDLSDNLENVQASVYFDNLYINNFEEKLNGDIFYYGPIEIAEGNVQTLETTIKYKDIVTFSADANMEKYFRNNNVNASIFINDLKINDFKEQINENLPLIKNYFDEDTIIKGSLFYTGNIPVDKETINSRITSSIVAKNASFLDDNYDISLNIKSNIVNNKIEIDNLSASILDYRLAFEGNYEINNSDVNGKLYLNNVFNNTELATMTFTGNNNFNLTNFDLFINSLENFNYNGEITFDNFNELLINSKLKFDKDVFDLNITADIENLNFNVISNQGLQILLDVSDEINSTILFDELLIKSLNNSIFDGELDFSYKNTDEWEFLLNTLEFKYNDLFSIKSKGLINQNTIALDSIDYLHNNFDTLYHGELYYTGPKYLTLFNNDFKIPYSIKFSYGDKDSQRIEASLFNDTGDINKIYLNVNNYNISSILNYSNEVLLDTTIIGKTDFDENHNIKGLIEIIETGSNMNIVDTNDSMDNSNSLFTNILSIIPFINLPNNEDSSDVLNYQNNLTPTIHFKSNIDINDNDILLENINLSINSLELSNTSISLNTDKILLDIKSKVKLITPSKVVNQKHEFEFGLTLDFSSFIANLKKSYSIDYFDLNNFNLLRNNIKNITKVDLDIFNDIKGSLNITNIDLFGDEIEYEKLFEDTPSDLLVFDDIKGDFIINKGIINYNSPFITSKIDLKNKKGSLLLSKDYILSSNIEFDYNNNFDIYLNDIILPTSLIHKILNIKLMKFYGDDFTGNLMITDVFGNLKYYGEAYCHNFRMKSLYTYDNVVTAPNVKLILNEDRIYADNFEAEYFDKELNKIVPIIASSSIEMPNFIFKYFTIDMQISDFIRAYMPLIKMNFTIDSKVKNHFIYSTNGSTSYLEGDIIVKDSVIRSGYDLLSWIKPVQETNGDLIIRTDENNTFYYPYFDNPIIKLTLKKDQKLDLQFDTWTKSYSATGKMDILQGEIFYFQKNFYLNEGSLVLKEDVISNNLVPIISLNATLRELDSNGDSVDINLQLINSTLNNINPIFSSIPIKSQQEIMEILGQSFSTDSTSNTVASIATAATSVISSLGYIDTGGTAALNNVIAESLNLDFFSLNSNIVENILLDTFIEDSRYSSYSPIARYLNNTSIYLGKYINDDSRIQILINLVASDDNNFTSFITDDLSLDFEMSYEIDTELADFSFFTNPTQLSILNILDTIGFSVTKTLHFR